ASGYVGTAQPILSSGRDRPVQSSTNEPTGLSLQLDQAALRPLVQTVVAEALAQLEAERVRLEVKLAYTEEEASKLLGVGPHVLRDERRRGRIQASAIVGRRIRYLKSDLVAYLLGRRWTAADCK